MPKLVQLNLEAIQNNIYCHQYYTTFDRPDNYQSQWILKYWYFSCPPGLQPNQVVNISCVCQNGRCLYSHNTATGSRFALTSDFESTIDFSCTDMYNYNYYEDDTLDKCMNLPDVQDGDWICSGNGTCALTYVFVI